MNSDESPETAQPADREESGEGVEIRADEARVGDLIDARRGDIGRVVEIRSHPKEGVLRLVLDTVKNPSSSSPRRPSRSLSGRTQRMTLTPRIRTRSSTSTPDE